jgi:hypothetical protein
VQALDAGHETPANVRTDIPTGVLLGGFDVGWIDQLEQFQPLRDGLLEVVVAADGGTHGH